MAVWGSRLSSSGSFNITTVVQSHVWLGLTTIDLVGSAGEDRLVANKKFPAFTQTKRKSTTIALLVVLSENIFRIFILVTTIDYRITFGMILDYEFWRQRYSSGSELL